MTKILLSGAPGSGKTTLVRRVIERLSRPVAGFYTQEIRQSGVRRGFELLTLDGEHGLLAHIDFRRPPRVGKYGVDLGVLERLAVPAIRAGLAAGALIVIDEIGPMELLSAPFRQVVLEALESPSDLLATVVQRSTPFSDRVKSMPGVTLLEVNLLNRQALLDHIVSLLEKG